MDLWLCGAVPTLLLSVLTVITGKCGQCAACVLCSSLPACHLTLLQREPASLLMLLLSMCSARICAVYGSLLPHLLNLRAGGNLLQILCKKTQKKQKKKS